MKEIYFKIMLGICIVACIALAIVLPMSAATIRPTDRYETTTMVTEFNLRQWSMYSLDVNNVEGAPFNMNFTQEYNLAYDCVVVTEHGYNDLNNQLQYKKTWIFVSDYTEPSTVVLDTFGYLTVNNADKSQSFDLTLGIYSIWFLPMGYMANSYHLANVQKLNAINQDFTNNGYEQTVNNWLGTAEEMDRAAKGSYNILARLDVIDLKNNDPQMYDRVKQQAFNEGKASVEQENTTLLSFISAIFTAPSHLINTMFDFEMFGFNMANVVKVIFTILVLGFFLKLVITKGVD